MWIAPGARHAVHVLEDAQFRTLYIDASVTPPGWSGCRVIVVSPLLRELVQALDAGTACLPRAREELLSQLVLDEITHADIQALGVPLPHAQAGDKRLRALCEAVLRAPSQRATLAEWAVRSRRQRTHDGATVSRRAGNELSAMAPAGDPGACLAACWPAAFR